MYDRTRDTDRIGGIRLLSDVVFVDPYPTYAPLRKCDPVHRDAELNGWMLTRYDDVLAACAATKRTPRGA